MKHNLMLRVCSRKGFPDPPPSKWNKTPVHNRVTYDGLGYIVTSLKRLGQVARAVRGRRPRHQASTLECVRHHSVRKWKYIVRFEKCKLCFDIGLSPYTFAFHGLACASIQCVRKYTMHANISVYCNFHKGGQCTTSTALYYTLEFCSILKGGSVGGNCQCSTI